MGAAILAARSAEAFAQQNANPPPSQSWDAGQVRHLLPSVSDTRILIKASVTSPLSQAPVLRIGASSFPGRMSDTQGTFWRFHAAGLQARRKYTLSLLASDGKMLCQPWDLSTFPSPNARPESFRVLFYTCAGGPDSDSSGDVLTRGNLPTAIRNRLLRRGLSFQPQAVIANGDHVYWDLHSPRVPPARRDNRRLESFNRSAVVFGNSNEAVLKLAAGPQIVPVYGTDFRSTPMFFLQDDHDYFDNDEAWDEIITFPPPWFQLQLARATQRMYYPEFLPDNTRPRGIPWGSADDGVSESWGTLRFGRLAEILMYDVRRTLTLAGPSAVFIDPEAERWLLARTATADTTHLVHVPSNPMGWTAGKWGEWYPDVLSEGKLTVAQQKPYWQTGWLKQHDRLIAGMADMKGRIPITISGDLHAVAIGSILRSGPINLERSPVTAVLAGPIGTSPAGWPSAFRGVGSSPSQYLEVHEEVRPIEQHGFTIADFLPDRIRLRFFKWDLKTQKPDAIDTLEPFHTTELARPA